MHAPVSTFEHKGKQYVVVLAGGSCFGRARGDSVWLFSLDGHDEVAAGRRQPQPVAEGAAVVPAASGRPAAPAPDRQLNVEHGKQLYAEACVACHGEGGDGGHGGGPTLVAGQSVDAILAIAKAGKNTMPAFGRVYSDADLKDVAGYISDVLAKK